MITTLADLLQQLLERESEKLDEYKLEHGPTIGKMYEGLMAKALEYAIPSSVDLNVSSGFIYNSRGTETPEIDGTVPLSV